MSFNKTWNNVKIDDSIELMEHPIFNTLIPKLEFYDEFCKVLDLLNGDTMSDYVDFFFERDVINNSNLKFVGDKEKMDFYDWAVDEGCLPGLKEIHQGESIEDKNKRIEEEEELERQRLESIKKQKEIEKKKRENLSEKDNLLKILDNKWKGIQKLKGKSELNLNKIRKAYEGFNKDYQIYIEKYGLIEKYEGYVELMESLAKASVDEIFDTSGNEIKIICTSIR